jgi:predicted nucleic acid-binding protein
MAERRRPGLPEAAATGMALSVLLDSVILIDHLNGVAAATAFLKEVQGRSAVSVITRAEVLAGTNAAGVEPAVQLLDRFPTLLIERETADLAASLRRAHRWRLPDAFQAALARLHGLKLATRNSRDFPPDKFDFVMTPYRVSEPRP